MASLYLQDHEVQVLLFQLVQMVPVGPILLAHPLAHEVHAHHHYQEHLGDLAHQTLERSLAKQELS